MYLRIKFITLVFVICLGAKGTQDPPLEFAISFPKTLDFREFVFVNDFPLTWSCRIFIEQDFNTYFCPYRNSQIKISIDDPSRINHLTGTEPTETWDNAENFAWIKPFFDLRFYDKDGKIKIVPPTSTNTPSPIPAPTPTNVATWIIPEPTADSSPAETLKISPSVVRRNYAVVSPGEITETFIGKDEKPSGVNCQVRTGELRDLPGDKCYFYYNITKLRYKGVNNFRLNFRPLNYKDTNITASNILKTVELKFGPNLAIREWNAVKDYYCYDDVSPDGVLCYKAKLRDRTPFFSCSSVQKACYSSPSKAFGTSAYLFYVTAVFSQPQPSIPTQFVNILLNVPEGPVRAKIKIHSNGQTFSCPPMKKATAPGVDTSCSMPISIGSRFDVTLIPTGTTKYKWQGQTSIHHSPVENNRRFFRVPLGIDVSTGGPFIVSPANYNIVVEEGDPNPKNPMPP